MRTARAFVLAKVAAAFLAATLLAGSGEAFAQSAQTAVAPTAEAPAAAAQTSAAPTPQQAEQALSVLRDDRKRAEMISVLETIARTAPTTTAPPPAAATATTTTPTSTAAHPATPAHPAASPAGSPAPASATPAAAAPAAKTAAKMALAPDSLGAEILVGVSNRLETLSTEVEDTARALTNFTLLERWAGSVVSDPDSRAELADAAWKLVVVAILALLVEAGVKRLIRRPRHALLRIPPLPPEPEPVAPKPASAAAAEATQEHKDQRHRVHTLGKLRRAPLVIARLLLEQVPAVAMATAGYGLLGTRLGEPQTTRLVILALLNAYVATRIVVVTTRVIMSPDAAGLRLIPFDPEFGWAAVRWMRRLAVVALFGYAIAEVLFLFGLYRVAHDALLKLVFLVVHLMIVAIVVKMRAPVARLIRAAPERTGVLATFRNRLAAVWHIIVIFYVVALWVVWALNVPGGFHKLVVIFVSTFLVSGLARLIVFMVITWLDHAFEAGTKAAARPPAVQNIFRRYIPLVRSVVKVAVGVLAILLLLQIWGLNSLDWFRGNALGSRLVSAVLTSGLTVAIGLAIWESVNVAIQNHLARLARDGFPARSARLRTLLPMIRTTLLVTISLVAGLTILSQIGVNIAPLLAGAGVVGLAIGFGSQKLVQDIITGLFLLLENTMQVGDVVTLGGLTGTVENLSIRTIRLRALDGVGAYRAVQRGHDGDEHDAGFRLRDGRRERRA